MKKTAAKRRRVSSAPRRRQATPEPWAKRHLWAIGATTGVVTLLGIIVGAVLRGGEVVEGAELARKLAPIVERVPVIEQKTQEQEETLGAVRDAIEQIGKAADADRLAKQEQRKAREREEDNLRTLCATGALDDTYCRARNYPVRETK